jgi:hypothetical protein
MLPAPTRLLALAPIVAMIRRVGILAFLSVSVLASAVAAFPPTNRISVVVIDVPDLRSNEVVTFKLKRKSRFFPDEFEDYEFRKPGRCEIHTRPGEYEVHLWRRPYPIPYCGGALGFMFFFQLDPCSIKVFDIPDIYSGLNSRYW